MSLKQRWNKAMSLKRQKADLERKRAELERQEVELLGQMFVAIEDGEETDIFAEAEVGSAGTDTYRMFQLLLKNPKEEFTTKEVAETLGIDGNRTRQAAYVLINEKQVLTREKRGVYKIAGAYRVRPMNEK